MSQKKIIKLPKEMVERIDKFIEKKGRGMGLENRTDVAKRAIDEFLKQKEY